MKTACICALTVVLGVLGLAVLVAGQSGSEDELYDLLMSEVPLTKTQFSEGEHQANDMGSVIILVVETCNGVPI